MVPCGFMAVSCYLYTVEGGTKRNLHLLAKAFEGVRAARCQWVMGLDAQQNPDEFSKWAAPLIEKAGGAIVSPAEPTHVLGVGMARTLDFFVIDRALAQSVVKVEVMAEL